MTEPDVYPAARTDVTVTADEWDGIFAALHSPTLFLPHSNQGNHIRSPFAFRGMSNASWPLKTSLERWGSPAEIVEGPALRAFSKYAPVGSVSLKSEWDRLAVAQHNGLPTRVLDWTSSPLVAAHFATVEKDYRPGGRYAADGVIWCVNADKVGKLLPTEGMREDLELGRSFVYNVPLLDSKYPELSDFDKTEDQHGDVMIFFEPPSIDARIQNQYAMLSVMNGPNKSHDAYLRKLSQDNPDIVRRIIIKCEAKTKIRDMLDQNNISERMLFPGLPGLSDWLRRYYGPA